MDIRFSGKNISVTEGMKEHLTEKLERLEKYAPKIVEAHVFLKKEKYLFFAEITLLAKSFRAYGDADSKESVFAAMDQAYVRIEKQLKKSREKVKDHHKSSVKKAAKSLIEEAETGEDLPEVIRSRSFAGKPMSTEEASMQLYLSKKPFLVFQDASSGRVNVLYKREDGNHGLIEPGY